MATATRSNTAFPGYLNIKVSSEQRQRLQLAARQNGDASMSAIVRLLIDRHIDELITS
jgi:hypothetical protein